MKKFMSHLLAILWLFAVPVQALAQAQLLPPGEQCFQANSGLTGMVGLLGTITPGSGYTNGTYPAQALTGGTGSQAAANITVSGGQVTAVAIVNPGKEYTVGDILTATLSGGGGFSVPIASTTINSSLAGGSVSYYIPNTLTFKNTWKDAAQSQLNTNPVQLDQNGCAVVYGQGTYRQILKDSLGNTIWDQNTSDYTSTNSPYWAGLAGGSPNAIILTDPNFIGVDGQSISFKVLANNTGPATIDASNFGALPVYKESSAGPVTLTGGELISGNIVTVTYDSTIVGFQIVAGAQEPSTTSSIIAYGQGRFQFISGISAGLCPFNGNKITFPSGNIATIPSACYTANPTATTIDGSPAALSVATLYYVYLWNSTGTTYAIDFSTTGHETDTSTGIETKLSDPTRVLIGMVYPVTGPNFASSNTQRLVISWLNRQSISGFNKFTANRATTSTTPVEINSEIRIQFLQWGEAVSVSYAGPMGNSGSSANQITSSIYIDSIIPANELATASGQNGTANAVQSAAVSVVFTPTEGFHFVTIAGFVQGNTGTWFANKGLSLLIRG